MSIAAVALVNGLNANMLRKWVIDAEHRGVSKPGVGTAPPLSSDPETRVPGFVPLALPAPSVPVADIRIEVKRGATTISVSWPASAEGLRGLAARVAAVIRIDAVWL